MFLPSKRIGSVHDTREKRGARSCNCKRSSCLKLYCECFANGSYCHISKCNCNSCHNNAEHNDARKAAIESTLDRNPHAFRSKIHIAEKTGGDTSTKHHKGCHCKKSNCLKKYCECFQGGVVCSEKCRCLECRNFTGSTYRQDAIQRANLKEKHGDGDPKNSHESSNNEDKASTEVQRLKTPTLQSKQRASIINEVNISIILQSLINSGKSQKRKYENTDESYPTSTSEFVPRPEEVSKIALMEIFISTLQDIVTQSIPSVEGNPNMSQSLVPSSSVKNFIS